MVPRGVPLSAAYQTLGLVEGCTVEQVRSAYKQLALKTHPDRNPDNPEATAKFQELGAAYNTLTKHLERGSAPSRAPWEHHHHCNCGDHDEDDEDGEEYYYESDEDDYFYGDGSDDGNLPFFIFIFDEVLKGHSGAFGKRFYESRRPERPERPIETEEEFQERLRLQREEQSAAAERRATEQYWRKERLREEREQQRKDAERRREQKASQKKAEAEALRKAAEAKVRSQLEKSQAIRSEVFAAARRGDTEKVKKGVWEESVDAAGGEVKRGSEAFARSDLKDPAETLLHVAAARGNRDLVEWLCSHNAEPEERNSAGLTAFHVALQSGHIPIVKHFFDTFPPAEEEHCPIYSLPASQSTASNTQSQVPSAGTSVLRLAIHSSIPELVWMVLENRLASKKDISEAWSWIWTQEGVATVCCGISRAGGNLSADDEGRLEEVRNLLMSYGGFTPPATPRTGAQDIQGHRPRAPKPSKSSSKPSAKNDYAVLDRLDMTSATLRTRPAHTQVLQNPTPRTSPSPSVVDGSARSTASSPSVGFGSRNESPRADSRQGQERGRGKHRGRGKGRGRGRGGQTRGGA